MTNMWGKPQSRFAWTLETLRDEHELERVQLERLLEPVAEELSRIHDHHQGLRVPASEEEQWSYESHIENLCEEMEGLLAVAFVITQSHITQIVSRALRVVEAAKDCGTPLSGVPQGKEEFRRTGSKLVGDTKYTEIQVLNSFANFFKHHEEWNGAWEDLNDRNARSTADVIMAVGARRNSSAPYRAGAEALGNGTYANVGIFVGIIQEWRQQLVSLLEASALAAGIF